MAKARQKVLAMVMAGGKGTRLEPLTSARSKPSVPFGGKYRIIDFVLSNIVNSGIYSCYVLTMFKSQSLTEHLQETWNFGSMLADHFIVPVPAQMRTGEHWYRGTADAIWQNFNLVDDHGAEELLIFGGDHIFVMNVAHMLEYSRERKADCTIACLPFPIEQAHEFGVIEVDEEWRIIGFQEKPKEPKCIPGQPHLALVSMGNYIFNTKILKRYLATDAEDRSSSHDFGKNVLPAMLRDGGRLYAYDYRRNEIPGSAEDSDCTYWRDVGTLDAFYEANMDLRAVHPQLDLYNRAWPIRSASDQLPPAKFVHNAEGRVGQAVQSIVCEGSVISGGLVIDSVVGRECRVNSFSEVRQCVLMDDVHIGRGAQVQRAIIDKHVRIPPGDRIGYDPVEDAKRFKLTEGGIVIIAKAQAIEPRKI